MPTKASFTAASVLTPREGRKFRWFLLSQAGGNEGMAQALWSGSVCGRAEGSCHGPVLHRPAVPVQPTCKNTHGGDVVLYPSEITMAGFLGGDYTMGPLVG